MSFGNCKYGFGSNYCTRVMCDDGNKILDCVFVQEWIGMIKQERCFRLFWDFISSVEKET